MTAWPTDVPYRAQINTLTGGPQDGVLRTKGDVGPPIMRNRYTGIVHQYSWSILMSLAQLEEFKTFYHTTLGNGALGFDLDDPVYGTVREFYFAAIYTVNSVAAIDYYIVNISVISEAE